MKLPTLNKPLLVTLALAIAAPALAQSASDPGLEARLRKLEAEVAALQRVVFPGGDGRFFPQIQPAQPKTGAPGTPASAPSADMLGRMDAMEGQLARLTAQVEEDRNRMDKLEARLDALEARGSAPAVAAVTPTPTPTPTAVATPRPAATPAPKPTAADPSARRLAAVRAIEKPQTNDPGDDEYSYGFRLWDAKFHPEAQQQLKLFLNKYPRHSRVSFARNLLGRSYLDEGNPREAASWFLQNYQADKKGDRAPDSLLYLAESMRQLKDTKRACVALDQFAREYPSEAGGRLKALYASTKSKLTCG